MSINHNNRPQVQVAIAGAASKKFPVLYAAKKMKVLSANYITVGAIAASGANLSTMKLQKSSASGVAPADIADNGTVSTTAGVAAYGVLALDVNPEIVLEAGEVLYLDHALTGTLALDGHLSLDVEIIGN